MTHAEIELGLHLLATAEKIGPERRRCRCGSTCPPCAAWAAWDRWKESHAVEMLKMLQTLLGPKVQSKNPRWRQETPAHQVGCVIMSLEGTYHNFKEGIISQEKMLAALDEHLQQFAELNKLLYRNKWE